MDATEVKGLSNFQLCKKVAELCGWKFEDAPWYLRPVWGKWRAIDPSGVPWCNGLPDYAKNLNWMRAAEGVLTTEQLRTYVMHLMKLIDFPFSLAQVDARAVFEVAHATARQRAIAFVLTMEGL